MLGATLQPRSTSQPRGQLSMSFPQRSNIPFEPKHSVIAKCFHFHKHNQNSSKSIHRQVKEDGSALFVRQLP